MAGTTGRWTVSPDVNAGLLNQPSSQWFPSLRQYRRPEPPQTLRRSQSQQGESDAERRKRDAIANMFTQAAKAVPKREPQQRRAMSADNKKVILRRKKVEKPVPEYAKQGHELLKATASKMVEETAQWRTVNHLMEVNSHQEEEQARRVKIERQKELRKGVDMQLRMRREEELAAAQAKEVYQKKFHEKLKEAEKMAQRREIEKRLVGQKHSEGLRKQRRAAIQAVKDNAAAQVREREEAARLQAELAIKDQREKERQQRMIANRVARLSVMNQMQGEREQQIVIQQRETDHLRNLSLIKRLEAEERERARKKSEIAAATRTGMGGEKAVYRRIAKEREWDARTDRLLNTLQEKTWIRRDEMQARYQQLFQGKDMDATR